jgi:hypothetical protein
MKLKTAISSTFLRKAYCISLMLFFSLSIFAGAALAKSCDGEDGCLSCVEAVHPHFPGMDMAKAPAPSGCQPFEQKNPCSVEISPSLDKFHNIIPAAGTDQKGTGKISGAAPIDNSPALTAAKFSLPPLYSDTQPTTPIFLIVHSLLC